MPFAPAFKSTGAISLFAPAPFAPAPAGAARRIFCSSLKFKAPPPSLSQSLNSASISFSGTFKPRAGMALRNSGKLTSPSPSASHSRKRSSTRAEFLRRAAASCTEIGGASGPSSRSMLPRDLLFGGAFLGLSRDFLIFSNSFFSFKFSSRNSFSTLIVSARSFATSASSCALAASAALAFSTSSFTVDSSFSRCSSSSFWRSA
mmetsp:Transcript_1676/g.4710  ORF Transcript_1676/g.4710 Transcript_1676/m.4710 type:complete len:204 (+) Transcript_1676:149-760(+)